MSLTSLLVCADADSVQVLSRVLQELGIDVESCGDSAMASQRIGDRHYNAVLIDCVHEAAAMDLIAQVRSSGGSPETVVIAIVDESNRVREIFAKGASFVLYKPISNERADHSLHAVRSLIRSERRVHPRIPLHTPVTIAYAAMENAPATIFDLNESGLGMHAQDKLPPNCRVYFQFALPHNPAIVRLAGEVMWQDSSRRVGIRFGQLPQSSMRMLKAWLQANLPEESNASEPEDPQVGQSDDFSLRLSAGLGLLSASAADRRKPTRQACCIGAQVFRSDNGAPIRCNLTDIGVGGCYVETTATYPEGTSVEIAVHTQDVKLRISGQVKSDNRHFGMGIEFRLRNEEQRQQVKQLIARAEVASRLI